jgi:hypothetical protein
MGGKGSTRWKHYRKKVIVEECCVLDVARLARTDTPRPGRSGTIRWYGRRLWGESAAYAVAPGPTGGLLLVVTYRHRRTGKEVRQTIPLESTPNGSHLSWWARCPLPGCGRRQAKLYRPPAVELFGCRECHQLTYASRQRHDKKLDRVRRRDRPGEELPWSIFPLDFLNITAPRRRRFAVVQMVEPAPD